MASTDTAPEFITLKGKIMGKLDGKVAVITGGNSGMGLATAQLFIKEGAKVVITGRRKDETEQAAKSLGANGEGFVGDVAKLEDLDRLKELVEKKYGRVDVVFANAGIGKFTPMAQETEAQYDLIFDVNTKGVFFTVQKLLPLIPEGGSIILNGSIASITGMAGASVYSATKAALRSFARTWTSELKDRKIRVNVISPGPIETPIFDKTGIPAEQLEPLKDSILAQVPMGRFGQPDEIAKPAVFLASSDSSFISGVELYVDGGMAQV